MTGVKICMDKDTRRKIPFKLVIFGGIFQIGLAIVLIYLFQYNFISYLFILVAVIYLIQVFSTFGWWMWFVFKDVPEDEEALMKKPCVAETSYNSMDPHATSDLMSSAIKRDATFAEVPSAS